MMNLDPTIEERAAYPLTPQADRWIYNKLSVAEKLGYACAPSGTDMTIPGDYVIRPCYGFSGEADGGVVYFTFDGTTQPVYYPGWFWCERFEGVQEWCNYTDGNPTLSRGGLLVGRRIDLQDTNPSIARVPNIFAGISKHFLIESIGGNIIEVGPRHMVLGGDQPDYDYEQVQIDSPYYSHPSFRWQYVPK